MPLYSEKMAPKRVNSSPIAKTKKIANTGLSDDSKVKASVGKEHISNSKSKDNPGVCVRCKSAGHRTRRCSDRGSGGLFFEDKLQ